MVQTTKKKLKFDGAHRQSRQTSKHAGVGEHVDLVAGKG
jgi:hypothetical protein